MDPFDLTKIIDISDPGQLALLLKIFPILLALLFISTIVKGLYNHAKLKPEEMRKAADLHTDVIGVLEKIYLAYYKKGEQLKKAYPRKEDIHILEHKKYGINSWIVIPNSRQHIMEGRAAKIYAYRYHIWRQEDRVRISALIAAWWFNIYYYTTKNQSIDELKYRVNPMKLGTIRRRCVDTLKVAGIAYLAEPTSRGNIDVVKLLTNNERIEHEHRRMIGLEEEDLRKLKVLEEKEKLAYGKPEAVHKVGLARIRHMQDLINLGKKQLKLLQKDESIRTQLGEGKADTDYEILDTDIKRLEVILVWLQTNINLKRGDKEQQRILEERLNEFEKLILDVATRLKNLDTILEYGGKRKMPGQAFA
jgi:hypothetical protein